MCRLDAKRPGLCRPKYSANILRSQVLLDERLFVWSHGLAGENEIGKFMPLLISLGNVFGKLHQPRNCSDDAIGSKFACEKESSIIGAMSRNRQHSRPCTFAVIIEYLR